MAYDIMARAFCVYSYAFAVIMLRKSIMQERISHCTSCLQDRQEELITMCSLQHCLTSPLSPANQATEHLQA
jgi:hypothetical protein